MHQRTLYSPFIFAMVGCLCLASPSRSEEDPSETQKSRAEFLGFSIPYPIGLTSTPEQLPWYSVDSLMEAGAIVTIDTLGCVVDVQAELSSDSLFVAESFEWIKSFGYVPARVDSGKQPGRLALTVRRFPRSYNPVLYFPVDSMGQVLDQVLYEKSLELNGVAVPAVVRYPSFFCDLKATDSVRVPPLVVLRVALDSAGKVTNLTKVHSSYPAFEQQVMSATSWATFRPASRAGRAVPCDVLLAVSFFPGLNYPTPTWRKDSAFAVNLYRRLSVSLSTTAEAVIRPPVLVALRDSSYTSPAVLPNLQSPIDAFWSIDTAGGIRLTRMVPENPPLRRALDKLVKYFRFYPAVRGDGRPVPFSGLVRIDPIDQRQFHLTQTWLQ